MAKNQDTKISQKLAKNKHEILSKILSKNVKCTLRVFNSTLHSN